MFKKVIGFGMAFYAGFLGGLIAEAKREGYLEGYLDGSLGLDNAKKSHNKVNNTDVKPHLEA